MRRRGVRRNLVEEVETSLGGTTNPPPDPVEEVETSFGGTESPTPGTFRSPPD